MQLTFGKYKGCELKDVPEQYLAWMLKTIPQTNEWFNAIADVLYPDRDWNEYYDYALRTYKKQYPDFDILRFKRNCRGNIRRIVLGGNEAIKVKNTRRRKRDAIDRQCKNPY